MRNNRDNFGFVLFDRCRPEVWGSDNRAAAAPIIEIMRDRSPWSRHGEKYRIIRNGYVGLAGKEALTAIETVLNRLIFDSQSQSQFNAVRDRLQDMLSRAYQNRVNLKQMAEDKVWPIFWGSMLIDDEWMDELEYTRETAKEKIARFREVLGWTKSDWAWACNCEPHYLYLLMSMPPILTGIRWPERLMKSVMPELRYVRRFQAWLKGYFIKYDGAAISDNEFTYVCRDVLDAEQAGLDLRHAYKAQSWSDFMGRLHDVEGRGRMARSYSLYGGGGGGGSSYRELSSRALGHLGVDPAGGPDQSMVNFFMPPRGEMSARPMDAAARAWLNEAYQRIDQEIMAGIITRDNIDPNLSTASNGQVPVLDVNTIREAAARLGNATVSPEEAMTQRAVAMARDLNIPDENMNEFIRATMVYGAAILRPDGLWGGPSRDQGRPKEATTFAWMSGLPSEINVHGCTAVLLGDNLKVWDEAATMSHCLYRSYLSKMMAKDYVAYHVTAPHLGPDHKGFTLGFKRGVKQGIDLRPGAVNEAPMTATEVNNRMRAWGGMLSMPRMPPPPPPPKPPRKPREDEMCWVMDQIRGYKNAFNHDTRIDAFVTTVGEKLNEVAA